MSSSKSPEFKAYLALSAGILIIGMSAIFVRSAQAPGVVTSFYRMAIGTVVMAIPFLMHVRISQVTLSRKAVLLAIVAGTFLGIDLALWTTGIMMSNATIPTLMANTAPLWVGLGAMLFFRERLNRKFWSGLCLAMLGVVAVSGKDLSQASSAGIGALLGLAGGLFYGGFLLVGQQGRSRLSTLSYLWISTASTSFTLLLLNLIIGDSFIDYPLSSYMYFLILGVVVQVGGWLLITYVQGHLPASIVATTLIGAARCHCFF